MLESNRGFASENSPPWNFLKKEKFTAFPDFLYAQYDSLQCKSFMGIFPEINRVWLTIDSRLYLWDYEGTGELALNTFDDQEQIIVSVGLVKPKPKVFLEQIEYLLVVTTPLEVILLGVAFRDAFKSDLPRGPLTLYRTEFSLSVDSVNMISVHGTNDGRIFMVGNDGNLYNLDYQSDEGWFTRKIRKTNLSAGPVTRFIVPPFLKWIVTGKIYLK